MRRCCCMHYCSPELNLFCLFGGVALLKELFSKLFDGLLSDPESTIERIVKLLEISLIGVWQVICRVVGQHPHKPVSDYCIF